LWLAGGACRTSARSRAVLILSRMAGAILSSTYSQRAEAVPLVNWQKRAEARATLRPVRVISAFMNKSDSRNRGRKNTKRQNPKMVFFICLAFALCSFGGLMFTATVVAATVSESGYTQAHGLPRSAIVTSVTNHDGRARFADVGVRLEEPVNGQAVTTAHLPSLTSLKPDTAVRVLVDPKDPGYAEFPGQRYVQNSEAQVGAIAFLACLAFFSFAAAWWGRVWYRQHKRRADGRIPGTGAAGACDLSTTCTLPDDFMTRSCWPTPVRC
jgi:hypothetical protein